MPLFTVAIPTYNRAHMLLEALNCLLAQPFQDVEILISNNASTDSTEEIIHKCADRRIRYIRQPENIGPSANFRFCADEARGDYLLFNQDDDLMSPWFLQQCADALRRHPEVVLIGAETVTTRAVRHHYGSIFGSVPLTHSWDHPQPRIFPGPQISALTFFWGGFVPPAVAIPTRLFRKLLRKHLPGDGSNGTYRERMLNAYLGFEGPFAFLGCVGAVRRDHPGTISQGIADTFRRSQENCAEIASIFDSHRIDWRETLRSIAPELSLSYRKDMIPLLTEDPSTPLDVVNILIESIAKEEGCPLDIVQQRLLSKPRLERWGVAAPIIRFARGVMFALGKGSSVSAPAGKRKAA